MRPSLFAMVSLLAVLLAPLDAAAACRYSKNVTHVFPADAFSSVTVNALAGRLDVTGASVDEITFEGVACADRERYLDDITLLVEDDTEQLELTVSIPDRHQDWDPRYAFMDIEITLPHDFAIGIRDSSGDILVRNAAVTSIDDSSGDIRVTDGRHALIVEDSSGDIDIRDLDGDLSITDSSGSIDVRDVRGSLTIPRDSSGDIDVEGVSGTVTIERDSSGEIEIENVAGSIYIGTDSSGDIEITEGGGDVIIGRDGSGRVSVARITGDFELEAKGSGDIRVRDIQGRISTPR